METNTWSEEDHLHGYCTQSQIGQPIDHSIWSLRDYQERACTATQIGQPKHPIQSPTPEALSPSPLVETHRTYAQKLNDLAEAAVDSVLNHPGGAKQWFKDNPSAHVRILTKLATPAAESQARVVVEIPWLQTGRLSYRNPPPETQVQDVEPRALPAESAAESWKEPLPPADVSIGMAILKKNLSPKG